MLTTSLSFVVVACAIAATADPESTTTTHHHHHHHHTGTTDTSTATRGTETDYGGQGDVAFVQAYPEVPSETGYTVSYTYFFCILPTY